jgi:hypothetical protein
MSDTRRDELDLLLEGALKEFVANEAPPHRVWTNIRRRVQRPGQQSGSGFGYLRHIRAQVMALGSDIGATAQIMLASVYVSGAWEEEIERLIVAGRSTVPLHYSIHH